MIRYDMACGCRYPAVLRCCESILLGISQVGGEGGLHPGQWRAGLVVLVYGIDWYWLVGSFMGTKKWGMLFTCLFRKNVFISVSHFRLFLLLRSLLCDHCNLVRYWWGYSQDSKANLLSYAVMLFEILYENWALFYRSFFSLYYCYTIYYIRAQ